MREASAYEQARGAYRAARAEHRRAVIEHYQRGRMSRREYLPIRDRAEEAAREMLRLRDETQLSLSLDTAGPERAA